MALLIVPLVEGPIRKITLTTRCCGCGPQGGGHSPLRKFLFATGDRPRGQPDGHTVELHLSAVTRHHGAPRRPTRWAAVELTAVIVGRGSAVDPTWPPRRFGLCSWFVAQLLPWQ